MYNQSHKASPPRRSRALDFDAPSPENRYFKRVLDRINCSKLILNQPTDGLRSATHAPQCNLPQSLKLKLSAGDSEECNANLGLSKLLALTPQNFQQRSGWAFKEGFSLFVEKRIEACYSENLSPLEASNDSSKENFDFMSLSARNHYDSSQKMEIEVEGIQKSNECNIGQRASCMMSKHALDKQNMNREGQESMINSHYTPSPKKKASIHLRLTRPSMRNERKYFRDIHTNQMAGLRGYDFDQTQQTEDQKLEPVQNVTEESALPLSSSAFQVMETIGGGSFGTVFKCKSLSDSKIYAIKRTNRKMRGAYRDLALHEVSALDKISSDGGHANVIKYFGNWIEDSNMFIAMEHCSSNLRELWKKKEKFSEEEIIQILSHLTKGLDFLHSHDIIHMDLKPENILFEDGSFKIGDFGLSRIVSPSFNGDFEEGDSKYLAPELLNLRFAEVSGALLKAADVYSLGMTIYELITNCELPAKGDIWQAIRRGQFDALNQVTNMSTSLLDLVKAMIDINPEKRPTASNIAFHVNLLLKERVLVKF